MTYKEFIENYLIMIYEISGTQAYYTIVLNPDEEEKKYKFKNGMVYDTDLDGFDFYEYECRLCDKWINSPYKHYCDIHADVV